MRTGFEEKFCKGWAKELGRVSCILLCYPAHMTEDQRAAVMCDALLLLQQRRCWLGDWRWRTRGFSLTTAHGLLVSGMGGWLPGNRGLFLTANTAFLLLGETRRGRRDRFSTQLPWLLLTFPSPNTTGPLSSPPSPVPHCRQFHPSFSIPNLSSPPTAPNTQHARRETPTANHALAKKQLAGQDPAASKPAHARKP